MIEIIKTSNFNTLYLFNLIKFYNKKEEIMNKKYGKIPLPWNFSYTSYYFIYINFIKWEIQFDLYSSIIIISLCMKSLI